MTPYTHPARPVVTDLTVYFLSQTEPPPICELDPRIWHRIEKELYLHTSQQSAYLYVARADEKDLKVESLVVKDIRVDDSSPFSSIPQWESRPGGLRVLRERFSGEIDQQTVTDVDILCGTDAVDPRTGWVLMRSPLLLNGPSSTPVARLSVLYGRAKRIPDARTVLRVREDGKFKIVQISDTHMVTGVGVCRMLLMPSGNTCQTARPIHSRSISL